MLRTVDIERQIERGRILLHMTSCSNFESILVLSLRELSLAKIFQHLMPCKNLQILFLAHNRISADDIRSDMFKLSKVRKLELSYNNVHDLPVEQTFFGNMKALEFLTLEGNSIQSMNAIVGLKHAQKLSYLSLEDNPV